MSSRAPPGGCSASSSSSTTSSAANQLRLSRPHILELPSYATEVVGHYDLVCPVCQSLPILLLGGGGGGGHGSHGGCDVLLEQLVELAEEGEVLEEVHGHEQLTEVAAAAATTAELELNYARRCFSERLVAMLRDKVPASNSGGHEIESRPGSLRVSDVINK